MSDSHSVAGPAPFTEAEIQEFRTSDKAAGAIVITLMSAIFLVGVCLYTVVAVVTF